MSSGDIVVQILREMPPAANAATFDLRPGASSPGERYPVYDFDASTIEYLDFLCLLSGYAGGGLTFTVPWSATSATSGTAVIGIAIRRLAYDSEDVDPSHSYDFNDTSDTAPGTLGHVTNPTITFTDGADMDSWADGELAIVRVRRNTSGNSMSGDLELWGIIGQET